jgi:hypothetical protein
MSNRITAALLVSLILAAPVLAKNKNLPDANRVNILPRDLEIKLALNAAPKHLRAGAGVYVLEENGYVEVKESSNGFNCYVGRPEFGLQVGSFEPICHNAEGSRRLCLRHWTMQNSALKVSVETRSIVRFVPDFETALTKHRGRPA